MKLTKIIFAAVIAAIMTPLAALSITSVADVESIVYDGYPAMSEGKTLYAQYRAQPTNEAVRAAFHEFAYDESKVKAYLDEVISYLDANGITTNARSVIDYPETYSLRGYASGGYDAKFAARGQYCRNLPWLDKSPMCFTNWMNSVNGIDVSTNNPVYFEVMKLCAESGIRGISMPMKLNWYALCGNLQQTDYRVFCFDDHRIMSQAKHDLVVPALLKKIVPEIKMWLRKSGKSFITKEDGVNPVQEEIDALQNALNAPKFAGLREWVARVYPDYQWIEPEWKSDEEINQLKEDIYYGQKDFTIQYKILLQTYLGPEAYNEFVEEYNK